ncbi:hypothetical protein PC119_g27415 [Phytophthora cactorum]|nr:hypothetical protein PC119_g27415 [Phytophthora cactorum]
MIDGLPDWDSAMDYNMCVYAWSSLICESEEACPLTVPIQRPHAFASVPIE